jgi:thymidine kinase
MIEIVVGSMFSGKTEELIRRLRRAQLAQQTVQVFKPRLDARYATAAIASHNQTVFPSTTIDRAEDILRGLRPDAQVIGVDEVQFLDSDIIQVVSALADRGLRVILAGLDMDWRGEPFGCVPDLMAIAEEVTKLRAVCVCCGQPALRTQRLRPSPTTILVGAGEIYEARCRSCFDLSLAIDSQVFEPSSKPRLEPPFESTHTSSPGQTVEPSTKPQHHLNGRPAPDQPAGPALRAPSLADALRSHLKGGHSTPVPEPRNAEH